MRNHEVLSCSGLYGSSTADISGPLGMVRVAWVEGPLYWHLEWKSPRALKQGALGASSHGETHSCCSGYEAMTCISSWGTGFPTPLLV